jgi:hypothetical protein
MKPLLTTLIKSTCFSALISFALLYSPSAQAGEGPPCPTQLIFSTWENGYRPDGVPGPATEIIYVSSHVNENDDFLYGYIFNTGGERAALSQVKKLYQRFCTTQMSVQMGALQGQHGNETVPIHCGSFPVEVIIGSSIQPFTLDCF